MLSACPNCGANVSEGHKFCSRCGSLIPTKAVRLPISDIIILTTLTVPGYKIKSLFGVVTGLTARTRGMGGKFLAGIQSMLGGEVSAFT